MKPANFDSGFGELLGGPVAIVAGTVVDGLAWKQPVDVTTTTAGTLASSFDTGDTVDGYVLQEGDRILIKNQATGAENGVYVVTTAAAPTRAQDSDTADEIQGAVLYVRNGTVNAGKLFQNTNTGTIVLETTAITYEEIAGTVTVEEEDASPSVSGVTTIQVPNGGLTNDGGGTVSLEYAQRKNGGVHLRADLGSLGATETINLANGNYQKGTLNANCTIGFTGWTTGTYCEVGIRLTEDGTGGYTPTFSGVTWVGGTTPTHTTTAGSSTEYVFWSEDGGTTIIGGQIGAAASGGGLGSVTLSGTPGVGSIIVATSSTTAEWAESGVHAHVLNEPFIGDASTTVFYLAQEADDGGQSVAAYVNGLRTDVTMGGANDRIIFASAPAASAAIRVDYPVLVLP